MNKVVMLMVLTVFTLLSLVWSCGMTTHIEITNRAVNFFKPQSKLGVDYKKLMMENKGFFTGGSPFPDWGYACGFPDTAENTHWPPFIHQYVKFVKEKYSDNPTRYNQLVSFLLGIESHGIADIVWHWGRETNAADQQGFLHSMGHMTSNCNDNWGNCHTAGDTGGDMYLAYRGGLKWFAKRWDIPVKYLADLYTSVGMPVGKEKIESCLVMMYIAAEMEGFASFVDLNNHERVAAFLTDEIDLWYHGGIDDMAAHVSWEWQNVINLLEGETTTYTDYYQRSERRIRPRKEDVKELMKTIVTKDTYKKYERLMGVETKTDENGDMSFSVNMDKFVANKNEILRNIIKATKPEATESDMKYLIASHESTEPIILGQDAVQPKFRLSSTEPRSYFGKSLTYGDFDGDGKKDLAVGAPGFGDVQQGAVYLFMNSNYENINYSAPHLVGEQAYTRFGYSLTTADVNHDGIDDLVVSAPVFGENGPSSRIEDYYLKSYYGKVYVYFGRKGEGIAQNAKPNVEITTRDKEAIFFNLGFFLGSGDCNGDGFKDILIGSPYSQQGGDKRGHAAVFVGIKDKSQVNIEDADLFLAGSKNYQEVGYFMACTKDVVVVGAPGFRHQERDYQASGAVHGIDFNTKEIKFSIYSDIPQARFGNTFDIDSKNNLLAVGAPSMNVYNRKSNYQNGQVFIFSLDKLKSDHHIGEAEGIIYSNISRSRFGKNLKFIDNSLMVSAAFYTTNANIVDNGKIFVYMIDDVKKGEHHINSAYKVAENQSNGGRFGEAIVVTEDETAISAPFTVNSDMKGEVLIFH